MRCYVCGKETPPRQRYCDRCRPFIIDRGEQVKRRTAMIEAYDRDRDAFRDHWSGVTLNVDDPSDPFFLCFDHLDPQRGSDLVVSSTLFNLMKLELTPEEFRTAFEQLEAHGNGEPFDRDSIEFRFWRRRSPLGHGRCRRAVTNVDVDACVVCGRPPARWSLYCPRCHRLAHGCQKDILLRVKAMKEAYSPELDGFLCRYTGVRLDDEDPRSPWFVTFDHSVPGDRRTLVVAAFWVNVMKTALSEEEFRAVVKEYVRYLREGGEFDRHIVEFRYWKKARRTPR